MTRAQGSTPGKERSGAQKLIGDFAPKLVGLTDDVLFGDAWARLELARRDRSLITRAALITNGSTEDLPSHLGIAKTNGVTETELQQVIIHLAFYGEWQRFHVGDHGREGGLRRLSPDVSDQLVSRCSAKGSPGARTWMRSGFSTLSGNESGSALNGAKSGSIHAAPVV